jgi:serine/threonine-protein kinase RsbW
MESGDTASAGQAARRGRRAAAGARERRPQTAGAQVLLMRCRAAPDSLRAVHDALLSFWEHPCVLPPIDWRMLFELAVAEVAANILEHARPPVLGLHLSAPAGCVIAEFTDTGSAWTGPRGGCAIGAGSEPDPLAERGRGLVLARRAVDEVRYEREGAVNRWRLLKRVDQ